MQVCFFYLVDFGHGHSLLWIAFSPGWLTSFPFSLTFSSPFLALPCGPLICVCVWERCLEKFLDACWCKRVCFFFSLSVKDEFKIHQVVDFQYFKIFWDLVSSSLVIVVVKGMAWQTDRFMFSKPWWSTSDNTDLGGLLCELNKSILMLAEWQLRKYT